MERGIEPLLYEFLKNWNAYIHLDQRIDQIIVSGYQEMY